MEKVEQTVRRECSRDGDGKLNSASMRSEHKTDAEALKLENAQLQVLVSELKTASPSVARLTKLAVSREREAFEDNKRRALSLLRKKDAKIRELGEAVSRRRKSSKDKSVGTERSSHGKDGESEDVAPMDTGDRGKQRKQQIKLLLQELELFKTASSPVPQPDARGAIDDRRPDRGYRALVVCRAQQTGDEFAQVGSSNEQAPITGTSVVLEGGGGVQTSGEATAAVWGLRTRIAELESTLAVRTSELAEMQSKLERTVQAWKLYVERYRVGNATLVAKVATLERLEDIARHTVLDREERLGQALARLEAINGDCGMVDVGNPVDTSRTVSMPRAVETEGVAEQVMKGGDGFHDPPGTPAGGQVMEDSNGAQEWWLGVYKMEVQRAKKEGVWLTQAPNDDAERRREEELARLRDRLHDQGVEIVTLRQKMLKVEMDAREKARELGERAVTATRKVAEMEKMARAQGRAERIRLAELETAVEALRGRGDVHEALATAREEVAAVKSAAMRAKEETDFYAGLVEDEKGRLAEAMSSIDRLQGALDRVEVFKSLQDVPGGVTPSSLVHHFAGVAFRQSRRIKALETEMREVRSRCMRLVRVLRGGTVESPRGSMASSDGRQPWVGGDLEHDERGTWAEAGVLEASVAMEAGRRRALEEEIISLRAEVSSQRRRPESVHHLPSADLLGGDRDDLEALRRELTFAHGEIDALRVHVSELGMRIQSSCWASLPWKDDGGASEGKAERTESRDDLSELCPGEEKSCGLADPAQMAPRAVTVFAGEPLSDSSAAALQVEQLRSLVEERNAQVDVLTATIEVLRLPTSSSSAVKRRGNDGLHVTEGSDAGLSRRRSDLGLRRGEGGLGVFSDDEDHVDIAVEALKRTRPRGILKHCIRLTARLHSAISRAGEAERRADGLAAELHGREWGRLRASATEVGLAERCRMLKTNGRKLAAALNASRAECQASLRDASEETSKLRRALRDAELGADRARQGQEQLRTEIRAILGQLQVLRGEHEDEINRLHDEHEARLKECADRLDLEASFPRSTISCYDQGGSGSASSRTMISRSIEELCERWLSFIAEADQPCEEEPGQEAKGKSKQRRDPRGTDRRKHLVTRFLRETATRLDQECFRAVRWARALEWELRRVRQDTADAASRLQDARVENSRLSARLALAEAVVVALSSKTEASHFVSDVGEGPLPMNVAWGCVDLEQSRLRAKEIANSESLRNDGVECEKSSSGFTLAICFLLEKRLAAATADAVASNAARAAAEAGEAAIRARAEEAEAKATSSQVAADVLESELERQKTLASQAVEAEASEWRREIKAELGRWWHDELMHLHGGVALDWESEGASDEITAVRATPLRPDPRTTPEDDGCPDRRNASDASVNGAEAMAQALIVCRAEHSFLKERLRAHERHAAYARGEALRLRAVLERWHREIVHPGMEARVRRQSGAAATKEPLTARDADFNRLQQKLLAANTELLAARTDSKALRGQISSLRALVSGLREDEREARECADRRVESAEAVVRRRAEGDLRDATKRLAEEREHFKILLGTAHADILKLKAELAELGRRNHDLEVRQTESDISKALGDGSLNLGDGDGGGICSAGELVAAGGTGEPSQRGGEGASTERAEKEIQDLRRVCHGLEEELKASIRAEEEAKEELQVLVQEVAKARAEALDATATKEGQGVAVKEVGHLLEALRKSVVLTATGKARCSQEGGLNADPSSALDQPRDGTAVLARAMIAAKVTEAELMRRLQAAAASEVELRHMLRRRDSRIEELKRERAAVDSVAMSGEGARAWTSDASFWPGARRQASNDESGSVAVSPEESRMVAESQASPGDRVRRKVSEACMILRLQLELAEATARGDTGEACRRGAERLAGGLVPVGGCRCLGDWNSRGWLFEGMDSGAGGSRHRTSAVSKVRGMSFLMPSARLELRDESSGLPLKVSELKAEAEAESVSPAQAPGKGTPPKAGDFGGKDRSGGSSAVDDQGDRGCSLPELGSGPLLKEPHSETQSSGKTQPSGATGGFGSKSAQGSASDDQLSSPTTFARGSGNSRRSNVVHETRGAQVATPEAKADPAGKIVDECRAEKRSLEEQVTRLKADLPRQKQKSRHGREFAGRSKTAGGQASRRLRRQDSTVDRAFYAGRGGLRVRLHTTSTGLDDNVAQKTKHAVQERVDAFEGMAAEGLTLLPQLRAYQVALQDSEETVERKEAEVKELRETHAKEALAAKEECERASVAQQKRIALLEDQLRRERKRAKVKVVKVCRRDTGGCSRDGRGGQPTGSGPLLGRENGVASMLPTSPSTDELYDMLEAAEEEMFRAKCRAERAEHERGALSAENDALRRRLTQDSTGSSLLGESGRRMPVAGDASESTVARSSAACDGGGSSMAAVACAARLVYAEAELHRLRNRSLVASQAALEARREASALRLATSRARRTRVTVGKRREKELQRQVSALKREVHKLRAEVGKTAVPRQRRDECKQAKPSTGATTNTSSLAKARAQAVLAREGSERRSRTIVALRTAKTSLEGEVAKGRRQVSELEAKLKRALRDAAVKGTALAALRQKAPSSRASIEVPADDGAKKPADCSGEAGGTSTTLASMTDLGGALGATVRDLRAERDRLRTSLRERHTLISRKVSEIHELDAEVKRLEENVRALRMALAGKDAMCKAAEKKLSSLRGAYESLESWSNRWRTDAETKLLRLKQVGESALKGAKAYRQNRDDLVRELAALKSALRSFLTTLWGDLQSRPCLMATLATEAGRSTQAGTRQVSAEDTCMPFREVLMNSAGSAAGFVMDALATEKAVDIPILPRCEASVPEAHEEDPPSAELTEGEISDMMNALSAECSTSFASFTGAAPTGEAKDGSEFKVLGSATSATHGVGAGRQSSPLDHDDAGFCARVESALGGRDSSPTLAKVLLSMRSQQ